MTDSTTGYEPNDKPQNFPVRIPKFDETKSEWLIFCQHHLIYGARATYGEWGELTCKLPYENGKALFERCRVKALEIKSYEENRRVLFDEIKRDAMRKALGLPVPAARQGVQGGGGNAGDAAAALFKQMQDEKKKAAAEQKFKVESTAPQVEEEEDFEAKDAADETSEVLSKMSDKKKLDMASTLDDDSDVTVTRIHLAVPPPLPPPTMTEVEKRLEAIDPRPVYGPDEIEIRKPLSESYDNYCEKVGRLVLSALSETHRDILRSRKARVDRPHEVIEMFTQYFSGVSGMKVQMAAEAFDKLTLRPGEDIDVFIRRFEDQVTILRAVGMEKSPLERIIKIKAILRQKEEWKGFMQQIDIELDTVAKGVANTYQGFLGRMRAYDESYRVQRLEARMKKKDRQSTVLLSTGATKECSYYKMKGGCRKGENCTFRHSASPNQSTEKKRECFNCAGKKGSTSHVAADCRRPCIRKGCEGTAAHARKDCPKTKKPEGKKKVESKSTATDSE